MHSNRANILKEEREKSLRDFMSVNACTNVTQLNQLVAEYSLDREYKIKDPSVLKWSLEELWDRVAVPVGMIGFNGNDQNPKLRPVPKRLYIYVIPPSWEDTNVYSIHCNLPPGDISFDLTGPQKVSRLHNLNWITGMNNGVSGFGLGSPDDCSGWHMCAYDLYKQIQYALKKPKAPTAM